MGAVENTIVLEEVKKKLQGTASRLAVIGGGGKADSCSSPRRPICITLLRRSAIHTNGNLNKTEQIGVKRSSDGALGRRYDFYFGAPLARFRLVKRGARRGLRTAPSGDVTKRTARECVSTGRRAESPRNLVINQYKSNE